MIKLRAARAVLSAIRFSTNNNEKIETVALKKNTILDLKYLALDADSYRISQGRN